MTNEKSSTQEKNRVFVASFLRLANEDYKAALLLSNMGNNNAAYHAQQAVEKIALCLLTAENIYQNPREASHQIDVFVRKLPDDNSFKSRLQPLVFLQAFASTFRYPKSTSGRMSRIEKTHDPKVKAAIQEISSLIDDLSDHFQVNLAFESDAPAGNDDAPRNPRLTL